MLTPLRVVVLALLLAPLSGPRPAHRAPMAARKTVAVLRFDNNTGRSDYEHLGTGMAAMLTTDLSAVDDIQLLERERLDDVTREIDRQRTPAFDSTTAVRVGRLSGAQFIVIGSLAAATPQLRIDTRVIRVETGAIVKSATVTGRDDQFFDLQRRLARQLVKDLDIALTPEGDAALEARQQAGRVDDVGAVVALSNAMSLADAGDFVGASRTIAPVVARYPNSTFVSLTASEIRARAAASAAQKAKTGINSGINKLLRKKWPPQ